MVLCDKALQKICGSLTFIQGQGQKKYVQRSQKVTLPFFSETIKATVTKFGTISLCDKALQNICGTLTFTQGQGKKKHGQKSQKVTLPFFSETIKATVTKFGTMGLCDKALQNICGTLTFTQGQGQKKYGQKSQKVTLPFFSETIKATVTKYGTLGVCDKAL